MKTCLIGVHMIFGSLLVAFVAPCAAVADEAGAQASPVQFKTSWAISAKTRYDRANSLAAQEYLRELDAAIRVAMQSARLDDANALNLIRKQVAAGGAPDAHVTMPAARAATTRYWQTLTANKQQYLRDLETALKWAMAGANLDEANAINAVRRQMDEESKGTELLGKGDAGLLLIIGGEKQLWKNTKISLPTSKTPVTLSGYLLLPATVKSLRLRSAEAYGSERLRFTLDGRTLEFEVEGNRSRFVTFTPPIGAQQIRIEIGKSVAATAWEWGPLQWSVNGGKWKDVPVNSLVSR